MCMQQVDEAARRDEQRRSEDDMIFTLAWIAKRRLDATPLSVREINHPAEFVAACTGVDANIVGRVLAMLDDPSIWSFGEVDTPLFRWSRAGCPDH